MEMELKRHIMTDLGQEYCELLEGNELNENVREIMTERIRNSYDGEIWDLVDSEENEDDFDFDDILSEIVTEVESLGNYYYQNIQDAKK